MRAAIGEGTQGTLKEVELKEMIVLGEVMAEATVRDEGFLESQRAMSKLNQLFYVRSHWHEEERSLIWIGNGKFCKFKLFHTTVKVL